jgi:hypothetical protein
MMLPSSRSRNASFLADSRGFWRIRMPSISGYNALTAGNGARDKRRHAV